MKFEHASIFVADDDAEDRDMIKEAFEANGYAGSIAFVADGKELLDRLSGHIPHIILLDLNMPKVDGREALKHIRSMDKYRRIPVIVLSTSSLDKDIDASYYLGCNCYITKPGSFGALVNMVNGITNFWLNICELPTLN